MPPFLQFRLWLREGPARERTLAACSALVVAALLVLTSLPVGDGDTVYTTLAAAQPAGAPSPDAGVAPDSPAATDVLGHAPTVQERGAPIANAPGEPTAVAPDREPAASAPAASVDPAAGSTDTCAGLAASAPGISPEEVRVAVSIISLAGPVGNEAFNVRQDIPAMIDAFVDEINKTGGVACGRTLVVRKYDVNPIDAADQQRKCLQMIQDGAFVVVDLAGYVRESARACFPQNKIPFQNTSLTTDAELEQGYPFIYGLGATAESAMRSAVAGLSDVGYFAPPAFQKIGLFVDRCVANAVTELEKSLAAIGVTGNRVSKYTLDCNLIASPNEITQAVLAHRSAGATHVFLASSLSNNQRYVQIASQQNFRPRWGTGDYGSPTANENWDQAFAGAAVVTGSKAGELGSDVRNPELIECDRILREHGLTGIEKGRDDNTFAIVTCDQFSFLRAVLANSGPNPTRQSFTEDGVGKLGHFKAAGLPDAIFERRGELAGGDFRRTIQFAPDCRCFKLRDDQREFKRV